MRNNLIAAAAALAGAALMICALRAIAHAAVPS